MLEKNNTIFDDVFRTMLEKTPSLVIPLINEVFKTSYPLDTDFIQLRNEHQTRNGRRITDSALRIGKKIYHIECQSTEDADMDIRMVEYDYAIALENTYHKKDRRYIKFPGSCVFYIKGKTGERHLQTILDMPDGRKIEYNIPVINVEAYTLDEIFRKKLTFLLPYYIIRYKKIQRKQMKRY